MRHLTFDSTHSAQWRPLDSRFSRLEARLTHHRRWLEKETENQIQNYDEIAQHRNRYFTFLNRQHDVNANNGGGLGDQRLAKRLRRVEKIKLWLSSGPSSVEVPNSNSRQQSLSSCAWFFETPAYLKWKNGSFEKSKANDKNDLEDTWQHRVLFVQGTSPLSSRVFSSQSTYVLTRGTAKPGFGKTFIWNTVIDQLSTEAEDPDISDEPPSTAFFQVHNRPEGGNPDGPFRALACQLIQTHRHNHSTLDAVCLLMRKTSFRENATTDEMLDVLSLLLRQHPTYLAIDGIDGCSDVEAFLASLAGLCRRSDAKVIVFSRPNIKIPLEYQKWASDAPHILPLTIEHNASAIEHFVAQDLNRMADQGFFGISMDRTSMPQVARIARGEFLWASILLKFLRSTALSSDERRAILENIQSLEGLESLYRNILSVLERRSKQEKRIIADVFRWLSFPINQLSPSALRAALSTFDIGEFEELCLADVLDILPELSCGLIDVHDMNITFAHESIREYLQTHLSSQNPCFSLYDEASVHAHLASRCLSYLAHDVPKRPLGGLSPRIRPTLPTVPTDSGVSLRTSKSGDSGYKSRSSSDGGNHLLQPIVHHHSNDTNTHSIRVIPFDTNLPFLRYAALCWPIHLSRALTDWNAHARVPTPHEPYATVPYLPALSAFLTSRLAVAAWVEASFRYNLPPTLTRLVGPLSDMKGEIPPATVEGKELRLVVNELRELSERLVELKREHVEIMGDNPSLIWQIDGDNYWPVWDDIREE